MVILEVPTSGSVSELRKKGFVETMAEIAPDMRIEMYATQVYTGRWLEGFC